MLEAQTASFPPRPTIDWVRLALAPVLVFIVTSLDRGYQTDFWQHLSRGRLIAETREVVSVDRFTFTVPDRPMRDNNWLTQVLYFKLFGLGGIELVQVVNSLALAAATAGVVVLCRRASGSTKLAAAGGVLVFLGLWQTFLIRPQSLSLGLFVGLLSVMSTARRDPRWLALPPVMMALWANLHGGFAIGLLLIGAFTAGVGLEVAGRIVRRFRADAVAEDEVDRRTPWGGIGRPAPGRIRPEPSPLPTLFLFTACLVLCVLATLLNPYGFDVYRYAADLSRLGLERGIEEWLPPSPELWVSRVFYASLVLLAAALFTSRRRLTARDVCLIACFLPPALIAVRMVPWWLLVIAPTLVRLAAGIRTFDSVTVARPSYAAGAALAALLLTATLSLPWLDSVNPVMGNLRPSTRAESGIRQTVGTVLADARPRRIFARFESGNYLCWAVGARQSVFMEGHVELYPDDVWQDYLVVSSGGAGWERVLQKYEVDTLLLDAAYHRELVRRVRSSAAWGESTRSGNALVFERRAVDAVAELQ